MVVNVLYTNVLPGSHRKSSIFFKETEEEWIWRREEQGVLGGVEGGDIIYKRRINFFKKMEKIDKLAYLKSEQQKKSLEYNWTFS